MKPIFITFFLLFSIAFWGQNLNDTLTKNLEEVKLEIQRYSKSKQQSSQQLLSLSRNDIELQNPQTTADLLLSTGKIAVQKSQQGGGSPVLRGFESSRILLLVDGVRMNNLIYRSGHLQNIITIDENMIENVDVLFGSSSTPFGSDALGGAINLITKKPKLLSAKTKVFSGAFNSRYSTVNNEKSNHLEINLAGNHFASLTSVSFNDIGDLKMGKNKNGSNDFFGLRPFYVINNGIQDIVVSNSNPYVQKFSGYKQFNAMQKLFYKPNNHTDHSLNLQYSTTNNIPRYDRLTDIRNGKLRYATWDYGPQKRFFSGYKFESKDVFFNSDINLGLNYQNVEESRISRDNGKTDATHRIEKVNVFSFNTDLKTKTKKGEFLYGLELYYDNVNSNAFKKNIYTNETSFATTRYPDGDNHTLRTDIFATLNEKLSKKLFYNLGLRLGHIKLYSEIENNSLNFPVTVVHQKNFTYSFASGLVFNPSKYSKIALNLASGFRVPNIDDLGKIFDSSAGSLIIPNADIKPEKNITTDISFNLTNTKNTEFEAVIFYTRLYDAIIVDDFKLNGESSILYENTPSQILANQNLGRANVFGYSGSFKTKLLNLINFNGNINYTYGRLLTEKSGKKPLDHIPPLSAKISLGYNDEKFDVDFYMIYNDKKPIKDYFLNGEDNEQYAPEGGIPAWKTLNLKTAYRPTKPLTLYSGIENIFDIQYRTFASGINAPGRNIYVATKYVF